LIFFNIFKIFLDIVFFQYQYDEKHHLSSKIHIFELFLNLLH
jgi:hypothetical protein